MKAMSLRISMATLSPCLTPSFCKPLAMRSARSATSSWPRLRGPLMMPWKGDEVALLLSDLSSGLKDLMRRHSGAIAKASQTRNLEIPGRGCFATIPE